MPTSRKDFQQLLDRLAKTGPEASAMIKAFRYRHRAGRRRSISPFEYRRLDHLFQPFRRDLRWPDLPARLGAFKRDLDRLSKAKKIVPPLEVRIKTVRSIRKAIAKGKEERIVKRRPRLDAWRKRNAETWHVVPLSLSDYRDRGRGKSQKLVRDPNMAILLNEAVRILYGISSPIIARPPNSPAPFT